MTVSSGKEPERLDGGEWQDEESSPDAAVEEVGGERGVRPGEGGVVVEREAGRASRPSRVVRVRRRGGGGGGGRSGRERVRADGLERGRRAKGAPEQRRRGAAAEEHRRRRRASDWLVVGLCWM